MSTFDKILQKVIYILAFANIVSGVYAILKIAGLNPQLELIPFIVVTFSLLFTIAIKIGRIQGKIEK